MWQYLLGDKKKQLKQSDDGSLYVKSTEPAKTKSPKNFLNMTVLKDVAPIVTFSYGVDDFVYGFKLNTSVIVRSNDGFKTIEEGFDFKSVGEPAFATKTPTGFLVYVNHPPYNAESSVWHSSDFKTGFEKVLDMNHGYVSPGFIARPQHNVENGLVIANEYNKLKDPTKTCRAWYSTQGGKKGSWVLLNEQEVKDSANNFHIHTCCYDPFQSRFYLSKGDYGNRMMQYSDDFGKNWSNIDTATQPTLLEPTRKYIVCLPDNADTCSVNVFVKNVDNDLSVKPFLVKKLNIASSSAYGNYGKGPAGGITNEDEMYFTFSESGSGIHKCYIVGTGDGGESFHLLRTIETKNGNGVLRGLVSDPKTKKMYGLFQGDIYNDGKRDYLVEFNKIDWE